MSTSQSWSGPGVILSFFKLLDSPTISEETLENWFDREYAPPLIASGVVKKAWLYLAANAEYDKQHLIVYQVPELAQVQAGKIQEFPRTSSSGLFEGTVDDYIEVETRIYSFVQLYEKSAHGEGTCENYIDNFNGVAADFACHRNCTCNDVGYDAASGRRRSRPRRMV